jgi:hypothetical protein
MAHNKSTYTMANATTSTNVLTLGATYPIQITGFTYVKEYALVKGKEVTTGTDVSVIIGDKMSFGMRDMFELKNSNGIKATYTKDKIINGVTYQQFRLDEILF